MRRAVKLAAAMLVAVSVMSGGRSADASLWGDLIKLTESDWSNAEINFEVWNNTDRKIEVKVEEWIPYSFGYWGSKGGGTLKPGETAGLWNAWLDTYRVRLRVWNSKERRWVLKDRIYVFAPGPYFIEAYKAGRGDFRLRRW